MPEERKPADPRRWNLEALVPKPRPYKFDVVDRWFRVNEHKTGDQILCERLRCSWFRLKVYRRDGLSALQADTVAHRLTGGDPYQLWPDWGMLDDPFDDFGDDFGDA
jgi:hypothetical protein